MRTCGLRNSEFPKGIISLCLAVLSIHSVIFAQTASTTPSPAAAVGASTACSSQLQTFQATQQALASKFESLVAQGANSDQIQAWTQQNAAQIATQQKLAQAISASQPAQPTAYITDVSIPADASPTLEAFLTAQVNLFNLRAQLHNQQLQSSGAVDEVQVSTTFAQQNASALQAQTQRAQILANESAQQTIPVPPPLIVPPGSSAQLIAFLTAKDRLMRDQIAFSNQYVNASPSVRYAAMVQWVEQNRERFQQQQALAQTLTPTTSTTQN